MKYAELRNMCEESLSGLAYDITDNILSGMDEDEEIDQSDFEDRINEEIDNYFIYYQDAWEYLQDNNITDFEDAIRDWGCTDICAIASYYARDEVLNDIMCYWDEYEDSLEYEELEED